MLKEPNCFSRLRALIKRVLEEASETRVRAVAVRIYEQSCRRIRNGTRSLETPPSSFTEMYLPAEKEACRVGRATEIPLDIYLLLRVRRFMRDASDDRFNGRDNRKRANGRDARDNDAVTNASRA